MDKLLADLSPDEGQGDAAAVAPATLPSRPPRDLAQMMRKIPVTLTLEVGSARISLQELLEISPDSVVPLDTLAGTPLVMKVNGTPVGRAEVVVSGDHHGLRVVELASLDLDALKS